MAMAKAILEKWAVAQKRHHLSDKQVQMARVMGTYKLCKVQVTNLNQILKYLYF